VRTVWCLNPWSVVLFCDKPQLTTTITTNMKNKTLLTFCGWGGGLLIGIAIGQAINKAIIP
jgi:hypothetical protein